jgi:hypothetical protein
MSWSVVGNEPRRLKIVYARQYETADPNSAKLEIDRIEMAFLERTYDGRDQLGINLRVCGTTIPAWGAVKTLGHPLRRAASVKNPRIHS